MTRNQRRKQRALRYAAHRALTEALRHCRALGLVFVPGSLVFEEQRPVCDGTTKRVFRYATAHRKNQYRWVSV